MKEITLIHLMPEVFAPEPPEDSGVWLRDVTVRRGERLLIEAGSGAGKTSLSAFIMGLRRDYRGRILFDNRDAASLSADAYAAVRRSEIAYMPQNLDLFPDLTARDNILLKAELTPSYDASSFCRQLEEDARHLCIRECLDRKAGRLSVGQMQRTALLRALAQPFDFLILDEPVSHLDDANNRRCADLVERRLAATGAAVIVLSVGNRLHLTYDRILTL